MKVCVTAAGSRILRSDPQAFMDAQVDPRFGRCAYFVIVNTDSMELEALPNVSAQAIHGAGVQAAQMVVNKGVEVVITGTLGPNAYQVLSAAGIRVLTGVTGTVREAVERYKSGQLQDANSPNVPAHFGTGTGMRIGFGRGMGSGRRGMRAFSGAGYPPTHPPPMARWQPPDYGYREQAHLQPTAPPYDLSPKDELVALEDYRNKLGKELKNIEASIKKLKDVAQRIPKI